MSIPLSETVNIDVCVCTFRRPQVTDTLRSLSALQLPDQVHVRVIVADNDETPSAKERVEACKDDYDLNVLYVHAPARNISIARNACLDHAHAGLTAFIDDDEYASPDWLHNFLTRYRETNAPAILGPVYAVYSESTPAWMRREDFHSIYPVWVNGHIITGYTSNVLLDRSVRDVCKLRFREELGKTGGEDSAFFAALYNHGLIIEYAEHAIVREPVPDGRAKLSWLAKRRFRMGQTHAMMILEKHGQDLSTRGKHLCLASAKLSVCLLMSFLYIWNRGRAAFWFLRGLLHAGTISGILGQKKLQQYGVDKPA